MIAFFHPEKGMREDDNGTAVDGRCAVCNERWSIRYYVRGVWYCAEHYRAASPPFSGREREG